MSSDTQPPSDGRDRKKSSGKKQQTSIFASKDRSGPPRQRRPALAALAVVLIVGGALLAGVLAIRLDSREPVLAAARDIPAGTLITEADIVEVSVASEDLALISAEFASDILDGGTYAKHPIEANTLLDTNILTRDQPLQEGRAIVAVPLSASLTPGSELRSGDVVEVVRIGTGDGAQLPVVITQGLVLSIGSGSSDELGSSTTGAVRLLVPNESAMLVIDAVGADRAGLALLTRDAGPDVELQPGNPDEVGSGAVGGGNQGDDTGAETGDEAGGQ